MKVFAISDLHLSTAVEKPMDIFGDGWQNHFAKISEDWQSKVTDGDLVLLGGDMSWGLTADEAASDYALVEALNGKKFVVRGNHDYYWSTLSKMRAKFPAFNFVQNNAYREQTQSGAGIVIAGSRGWTIPAKDTSEDDIKIFVIADELSKSFCFDCYALPAGSEDVFLSGRNRFSLSAGNSFRFDNNDSAESRRKKSGHRGTAVMIISVIVGQYTNLSTDVSQCANACGSMSTSGLR